MTQNGVAIAEQCVMSKLKRSGCVRHLTHERGRSLILPACRYTRTTPGRCSGEPERAAIETEWFSRRSKKIKHPALAHVAALVNATLVRRHAWKAARILPLRPINIPTPGDDFSAVGHFSATLMSSRRSTRAGKIPNMCPHSTYRLSKHSGPTV